MEKFSLSEKKVQKGLGCRHTVLGKFFKLFEFQGFNVLTLQIGPFFSVNVVLTIVFQIPKPFDLKKPVLPKMAEMADFSSLQK